MKLSDANPENLLDVLQIRIAKKGYNLPIAGKTTILYKLKLGEIVTTIPTIGILLDHD